jgi:threonine/homoserine/homoserine lactone efflux protein
MAIMGVWFVAFMPQFVDPTTDYISQAALFGLTAMAAGAISDGGYAVLAGGARTLLSEVRVRAISRIGGLCLIDGGAWLAFTRSR